MAGKGTQLRNPANDPFVALRASRCYDPHHGLAMGQK